MFLPIIMGVACNGNDAGNFIIRATSKQPINWLFCLLWHGNGFMNLGPGNAVFYPGDLQDDGVHTGRHEVTGKRCFRIGLPCRI